MSLGPVGQVDGDDPGLDVGAGALVVERNGNHLSAACDRRRADEGERAQRGPDRLRRAAQLVDARADRIETFDRARQRVREPERHHHFRPVVGAEELDRADRDLGVRRALNEVLIEPVDHDRRGLPDREFVDRQRPGDFGALVEPDEGDAPGLHAREIERARARQPAMVPIVGDRRAELD